MIYPASEARDRLNLNQSYAKAVDDQARSVMSCIERAIERGESRVCFSVALKYVDDVKKLFVRLGYTFRPTGYVGGVWQRSEDICW
jgi:6-phosphogluconate dehydrogenase